MSLERLTQITTVGIQTGVTLREPGFTGSATYTTPGNITAGVVTASQFIGDGSGITGVTASGSGVNIRDNGQIVGVAGTINFGSNLDVSPASAGFVTVTQSTTGVHTSGTVDTSLVKVGTAVTIASGVITATTFKGSLTGDVTGDVTGNADTATTATTATNITVSANNSTDETVYPIFVDGATGGQGAESDTGFTYNPSSGNLTATQLTGTLQTAAQTNITSVGTLGALTVDNITIDGTTIGHTSDTDLMTLADGAITLSGQTNVGTAATIFANGNVTAGIVTASSFVGNGSGLTNISGIPSESDTSVSSTSATTVATFSASTYRTAFVDVQITQGSAYQAGQYALIHDGTTATIVEKVAVATGSMLGTLTATVSGGNMLLQVNMGSSSSATVTVKSSTLTV